MSDDIHEVYAIKYGHHDRKAAENDAFGIDQDPAFRHLRRFDGGGALKHLVVSVRGSEGAGYGDVNVDGQGFFRCGITIPQFLEIASDMQLRILGGVCSL